MARNSLFYLCNYLPFLGDFRGKIPSFSNHVQFLHFPVANASAVHFYDHYTLIITDVTNFPSLVGLGDLKK